MVIWIAFIGLYCDISGILDDPGDFRHGAMNKIACDGSQHSFHCFAGQTLPHQSHTPGIGNQDKPVVGRLL
jgi:hypothetical protein